MYLIQYMHMNTKVFNIVLPQELVSKADSIARSQYRNRSELIREALRVYIADTEEQEALRSVKFKQSISQARAEYKQGKIASHEEIFGK